MTDTATRDGLFQSTDWTPIGEINGQKIYGRHISYDELGDKRCRFAVLADTPTVYSLGRDESGLRIYSSDEPGRPSFHPAYDPEADYPAQITVRQGWNIVPRYLADGRPWVTKLGGSEQSAHRPAKPDFADPAAVESLDSLVASYKAALPECPARIDLYRACEGDNPGLLRAE